MISDEWTRFKGIIVAMNACYDDRGDVNPEATKRLARYYADVGVTGLYVSGSTGEGMVETVDERKMVMKAVMEEVGNDLTIIAHIGTFSTRHSIELAVYAESLGVHALSSIPSMFYRISSQGVEKHWNDIIDSTSLPFILYHIPSMTGFELTTEMLARMAKLDKVIGVKVTTESSYELQQFKRHGGDRFLVFNGPDEQYLAGRIMGADGGIGGSYGVMPELFLHIEKCFREGNIREAQHWQFVVNDIISDLLSMPFYAACKEILNRRGFQCGTPRSPLEQLDSRHSPRIAELKERIARYVEQVT